MSCWPLPQQLLPVSAAGSGRRCCSGNIILDFANPAGLRPRRICLFTGRVVPGSGIVAAVGLRPKRSENRCFYGMNPLSHGLRRASSPERGSLSCFWKKTKSSPLGKDFPRSGEDGKAKKGNSWQSRKALPERVQSSTGSSFMPNNFSESRGSRCCNWRTYSSTTGSGSAFVTIPNRIPLFQSRTNTCSRFGLR